MLNPKAKKKKKSIFETQNQTEVPNIPLTLHMHYYA